MSVETLSKPLNESLDDGESLEFGYVLVPDAGDPSGVLETARVADGLGSATTCSAPRDRLLTSPQLRQRLAERAAPRPAAPEHGE